MSNRKIHQILTPFSVKYIFSGFAQPVRNLWSFIRFNVNFTWELSLDYSVKRTCRYIPIHANFYSRKYSYYICWICFFFFVVFFLSEDIYKIFSFFRINKGYKSLYYFFVLYSFYIIYVIFPIPLFSGYDYVYNSWISCYF